MEPYRKRIEHAIAVGPRLDLLRSHRELAGLAVISFLYQLAHCVLPSMYVLYTS